jgi:hypothetical protein
MPLAVHLTREISKLKNWVELVIAVGFSTA